MSLSKVWNVNERFRLVFTKTLVFMPKTGSINAGTDKNGLKQMETRGRSTVRVFLNKKNESENGVNACTRVGLVGLRQVHYA